MKLQNLPEEVILKILSFRKWSPIEVMRLSGFCKKFFLALRTYPLIFTTNLQLHKLSMIPSFVQRELQAFSKLHQGPKFWIFLSEGCVFDINKYTNSDKVNAIMIGSGCDGHPRSGNGGSSGFLFQESFKTRRY